MSKWWQGASTQNVTQQNVTQKYIERCACGKLVSLSDTWWHRSTCPAWGKVVAGMVEAMARAIALEEGAPEGNWPAFIGHALAALGALRSPSVQMIGAGAVGGAVSNDAAAAVWSAMIDAAGIVYVPGKITFPTDPP